MSRHPSTRAGSPVTSVQLVDRFFRWVDKQFESQGLLPSSPLTAALAYVRERRDGLEVYLNDPDVAIDTNHLERALRPRRYTAVGSRICGPPTRARGESRGEAVQEEGVGVWAVSMPARISSGS
jgi:hypothetical protein